MKNFLVCVILLLSFGLRSQTLVRNVDAATFKKYIEEKKGVLIDLRTDEEISKKGMIPGAKQIDYFGKDSEKEISSLDHSKTYLIYCAGGGRSSECAELMKNQGFREVINLEKGFDDWKKKGFSIQQHTTEGK
jgi:phage shock protein E